MKELSFCDGEEVILDNCLILLFVLSSVGISGVAGDMLGDGDGLLFNEAKLPCEKI